MRSPPSGRRSCRSGTRSGIEFAGGVGEATVKKALVGIRTASTAEVSGGDLKAHAGQRFVDH
jgi:hypothetical protein